MGRYTEIRREAFEANIQIPALGLAIYTFGNVSAYDPDLGVFAIKPSGVPYADLKPGTHGRGRSGQRRGRRRFAPVLGHQYPIRVVQGVRWNQGHHAHAFHLCHGMGAGMCMPIPVFGTTHADHLAREVPCTEVMSDAMIRGDYETETGNQILAAFKGLSPAEVEMVLVACHGPFTLGPCPAEKALYKQRRA